jgi:O-methyltransferase domain/Dimerisation domain
MTTTKLDTVRLQNMARAFIGSASLFAAIDLKLFTAVAAGKNTVEAFAAQASISAINAERLMTMCAANGLLEWRGDHYVNAPDVERFLVEVSSSYAAPWLLFTRPAWDQWGELTEHLRNTAPPKVIGTYENMTVDYARRYHTATSSVGFGAGRRFVKRVDLSQRRKLMDLGGGSGAYSIVAAQTYAQLHAVVFDLPPVVVVTQEFIDRNGVADRVTTQGGDFTKDAFPTGCDVAIMASNLPQYSRAIIQQVIHKTHAALQPGGEMHLIGEMLDDDRTGPADAALWGLYETMANSTGITHTRGDCVGYFEAAGFVDIAVDDFIPGILVRVSGRKP